MQPVACSPEIKVQAPEPSSRNNFSVSAPPQCGVCAPLTAGSEQPVRKVDLERSAGNGCAICALLQEAYAETVNIESFDHVSGWSDGHVFGLYLGRDEPEEEGKHDQGIDQTAAVIVLACIGDTSTSPFTWLPQTSKSPFSRTPAQDMQNISAWINNCQLNHASCRQPVSPMLPTRVIDVGSDTEQPFLKTTAPHETGRYLALSHRWGTLQPGKILSTTKSTIDELCRGIPFESFPLTFRHAIEVARALRVRYLWIDSLCIVQDDIKDWEMQAARMGDIFENAYATLFAERAAGCDGGLFQTPEDAGNTENWIRAIGYSDPVSGQRHQILVSHRLSYYPSSLQGAFCLVDKPVSYLQDRGWILQEEILSRRKICFSATELHWQCFEKAMCECGLESAVEGQFSRDPTRNLLLTRRQDGTLTRGLSSSASLGWRKGVAPGRAWMNLVEAYTKRTLTVERDRLSALAGIASKIGRPASSYLAGIWLEEAGLQLLWRGWNTDTKCGRYDSYYAPTWSWTSVRGPVRFSIFGERKWGYTDKPVWQVLDGSCAPSGENPMGSVASGMVRIRGYVAAVMLAEREGVMQRENSFGVLDKGRVYERHDDDGTTYHLELRTDVAQTTGEEARSALPPSTVGLDTEKDWDLFAVSKMQRFHYLIACIGNASGAFMSDDTLRTMGLLIRESPTQEGVWERVSVITPQGRWVDWRAVAEERVIELV